MPLLSRLAVQAARAYGALSFADKNRVSASYLVVAGGGGGGGIITNGSGGGGGAGGYLTSSFTLSTLNTYSITVGAGGTASVSGSNSIVSGTGLTTVTSTGGGAGAEVSGNSSAIGGSGGGGSGQTGGTSAGAAGTSGQGNAGGTGGLVGANRGGGGGGGASAVGSNQNGGTGQAGAGGAGSASSISGSSVTYAGGGGGGGNSGGAGGAGGGANGASAGTSPALSGTANTGGGGGGGDQTSATRYGGSGGSGIVIISYASATPKFVGGTLTTSGGNQIHTFTSSGTLSPLTPVTASYLVVAGGGSGSTAIGFTEAAGGGGAGGLLSGSTTLYSGATYVVTVGGGGAGSGSYASGNNGSNSVLSGTGLTTITSTGGGRGNGDSPGENGGSGGGAGAASTVTRSGGTGTVGQGNNGGNGFPNATASLRSGGGGGGSGAVGANATSGQGGAGGAGTASSITGTSVTYAAGGGGSSQSAAGSGGSSIGGNGQGLSPATSTTSGTVNTGAGGGGSTNGTSGSGGSGVVIISYAGSQVFNGGLVTSSGGNTIHTFTATGALTPLTNNLTNSLRFRSSASAYLNRTPASAGNRQTWTWSAWVKLGTLSTFKALFYNSNGATSNGHGGIYIESDNTIWFAGTDNGSTYTNAINTSAVFRDPSAWYHIVVVCDTTNATSGNRSKIYVNGNQQSVTTTQAITQNANLQINKNTRTDIGLNGYTGGTGYFDGYMTDINFIDGQALEPYYFGNNDANGVWKPIKYTGTYGTNGFYLTFADTSALTTSSNVGLGKDTSGNGNYWTTNNISITAGTTYDAMTDVPTNTSATVANYCVLNPLDVNAITSITEANLYSSLTASASAIVRSTIAVTSGKYYWEVTFGSTGDTLMVGVCDATTSLTNSLWSTSNAWMYYSNNGNKYNSSGTAYGATFTNTDIIGVALDMDAGTLTFYKNNVSQGVAYNSGLTGKTLTPTIQSAARALTAYANFGQRPFSYTPPTGYVALNTFNLPTPTILQGNKYMDATTYSGASATNVIVNQGQFKPDLVWMKNRSSAFSHYLNDSVRGAYKTLFSNLTNAEFDGTSGSDGVSTFNSNGFTLLNGTNSDNFNKTGQTYVGWQWQAGQGSTSSNTSGSITSTTSVSTTAGFSVVTYTGNGSSSGTFGHGLGVAPAMFIIKSRSQTGENWVTWHKSFSNTAQGNMSLNTTGAVSNSASVWGNTAPTSTLITVGNSAVNNNTSTYVAYCWAEIAGFSKFGSYTGNGSADGTFVFTGFRPKYILIKVTSAVEDWMIYDSARGTYNANSIFLRADTSDTGGSDVPVDFLSNGFKLRSTALATNSSGNTYIYAAFAENPFKNANAR